MERVRTKVAQKRAARVSIERPPKRGRPVVDLSQVPALLGAIYTCEGYGDMRVCMGYEEMYQWVSE